MSTTSNKFKTAWEFESGALTTDSKGSNTLTNNNVVVSDGAGGALFVAASAQSFTIADNDDVSMGTGRQWFAQVRFVLDALDLSGKTIYSKDDTGSVREQFFMYLPSRMVWDTWTDVGNVGAHRLDILESISTGVEYTAQLWWDGTNKCGRLKPTGSATSGTYQEAVDVGWDGGYQLQIGALNDISGYYLDGKIRQMLIAHTSIPDAIERDFIIDKTWAQIVAGATVPGPSKHMLRSRLTGGFPVGAV